MYFHSEIKALHFNHALLSVNLIKKGDFLLERVLSYKKKRPLFVISKRCLLFGSFYRVRSTYVVGIN